MTEALTILGVYTVVWTLFRIIDAIDAPERDRRKRA